jgi:AhpD family alkylhydroperoxidase
MGRGPSKWSRHTHDFSAATDASARRKVGVQGALPNGWVWAGSARARTCGMVAREESSMQFHGVDVARQFKRMRELAPEAYRAWLEFDQKAFQAGAIELKTKELIALGIAHVTQCPWCIDAHVKRAERRVLPTRSSPK